MSRLKGTVVNPALTSPHGGSFEITLTVPLIHFVDNLSVNDFKTNFIIVIKINNHIFNNIR